MTGFEELGVSNDLVKSVSELGFEEPMPVQKKVIPFLLEEAGKDLIALAQTGTGKTAAFGLPLIQQVNRRSKKTQAVIIAPTRELCVQIAKDLTAYAKHTPAVKITAIYGGSSIAGQIKSVKQGCQIISATPGRLNDLINRGAVNISTVQTVVLDEADEMLNMGFKEELENILAETPAERQTLLFSATMPDRLLGIAKKYMNHPKQITIGTKNRGAETVEHHAYFVQARERYLALKRIVDFYPDIYGIVFCRTRRETQEIADKLLNDGYDADSLHGDLSQVQRDVVMNKFRNRHLKILVATDVAARGLDVVDLTHIINYNLPDDLEIYTHRSGRTGRAGKTGISVAIAGLKEKSKLRMIEKQIAKKFIEKQIPTGREICKKQVFHLVNRVENVNVDYDEVESFLPAIYEKLSWMDREELIRRFVSVEFNRFLEYYKNLPDLTAPETSRSKKSKSKFSGQFTRFFINIGKKEELKPQFLIGLVNDLTGQKNIQIGEIEIMKSFSFFEVDSAYADIVLKSFRNGVYKKRDLILEVAEREKRPDEKKNFKRGRKSSRKNSNFKRRKKRIR